MGLGAMQLLPIGRKQMLATVPYERSVVRRSRGLTSKIVNSESSLQQRQISWVATSSFLGKSSQTRRSGVVLCSESSVVDSVSEPAHDLVDPPVNSFTEVTTSPPVNSLTEAGIEVVRSIEEAENEVLKAVSAQGEGLGKEAAETLIVPLLDLLSTEEHTLNGQTQLVEQPSSAVAASLMVSEVANVLKTLEKDGKESEETDMSNLDETELVHDKLLHGIEQLTSSVDPSLMAPEMAEFFLHEIEHRSDDSLLPEENEMEQGSASLVESKNIFEQLREIVVFAGPALGIWLSGPIMSLIDTAVIGNSSSLELAALGKCSRLRVISSGLFFAKQ